MDTLGLAFQLIPLGTDKQLHREIALEIIHTFSKKIFLREHDERIEYNTRHSFFTQFARFTLSSEKEEIPKLLLPMLENMNNWEATAEMLNEFISVEDQLEQSQHFWLVWEMFEDKILEIAENGDDYGYVEQIVESFLFARAIRLENIDSWHSIKDENIPFFKKISEKLAHCPSAFYAISKLLNNIGHKVCFDEGVKWLAAMIRKNPDLVKAKLVTSTVYYVETYMRKYLYLRRNDVIRSVKLKKDVLIVLDFLIERDSVTGFMLRENVL